MYEVSNRYKEAVRQRDITSKVMLRIADIDQEAVVKRYAPMLRELQLQIDLPDLKEKTKTETKEIMGFVLDNENIDGNLRAKIYDEELARVLHFEIADDATVTMQLISGTEIDSNDIISCIVKDYCNDEGTVVGTAMLKEIEIELYNRNDYDLNGQWIDFYYGIKVGGNDFEYVPYGRYLVTSFEDEKANKKYKMILNDEMVKLNADYEEINTFPTTLWNYYETFASYYGIEVEQQQSEVANANFTVYDAPVYEGTSGRIVLSRIAELFGGFAKVNRDNKLQIYLKTPTDDVIETGDVNTTLKINDIPNEVNGVSLELGGGVEGENVTRVRRGVLPDELHLVRIIDNPFVFTESLREQAIDELFEKLDGFSYVPFELQYKGRFYYDCGDMIKVQSTDGEFYDTIVMNQYFEIPATRKSTIISEALTKSELKYRYESKSKQAQTRTELIVNKHDKQINSIVQEIGDRTQKTTTITQDLERIESSVELIVDLTNDVSGYNPLTLENCMNGELQFLRIKGNNTIFDGLTPSNTLVPSNTLIPRGDSWLYISNSSALPTDPIDYEQGEIDFITGETIITNNSITTINFIDISSFEELIYIINRNCLMTVAYYDEEKKYIGQVTMSSSAIEKEDRLKFKENWKYLKISFYNSKGFEDFNRFDIRKINPKSWFRKKIDLKVKPLLKYSESIYDEFIYNARANLDIGEVKAKVIHRVEKDENGTLYPLAIPKEEIIEIDDLIIDRGTNIFDFSAPYIAHMDATYVKENDFTNLFATTYEVRSAIVQLSNAITLLVNEKVGADEIIARLNVAVENGEGIIRIEGNKIVIDTDYFSISEEGKATIRGKVDDLYIYTDSDINMALGYIKGTMTLPQALINLYDCNNDGTLDIRDVTMMKNIKEGRASPVKTLNGSVTISADDLNNNILLTAGKDLVSKIGMYQMESYVFQGMHAFIGSNTVKDSLSESFFTGIAMNGAKPEIQLKNKATSTGTRIDADMVETYTVYASNGAGGKKGKCMHSPDYSISSPDHEYLVHYNGASLIFYIDPPSNQNWTVGNFWINTGSSDERLKHDIEPIHENLLKAINELQIIQFVYNNDEKETKVIGVVAQELLALGEKYDIDLINDYDIVKYGITMPDDENKYYAVDYERIELLKIKCLEIKNDYLEKRLERIEKYLFKEEKDV